MTIWPGKMKPAGERAAAKSDSTGEVCGVPRSRARLAPAPPPRQRAVTTAAELAALPDNALLEAVQRQTFRFFWEGSHPASGLALDRRTAARIRGVNDKVAIGGSGFGVMALIVAVKRGWVTREAAVERIGRMLDALFRARSAITAPSRTS